MQFDSVSVFSVGKVGRPCREQAELLPDRQGVGADQIKAKGKLPAATSISRRHLFSSAPTLTCLFLTMRWEYHSSTVSGFYYCSCEGGPDGENSKTCEPQCNIWCGHDSDAGAPRRRPPPRPILSLSSSTLLARRARSMTPQTDGAQSPPTCEGRTRAVFDSFDADRSLPISAAQSWVLR